MKPAIAVRVLLFVGMMLPVCGPASAADPGVMSPGYDRGATSVLPFPRSARAAAVWAESACWRDCQRTCTWGLAGCLKVEAQGLCLASTDACDRSCQRQCRVQGGPYLPIYD